MKHWLGLSWLVALLCGMGCRPDPAPVLSPSMKMPAPPNRSLEYATLGGGCFWCTEAVFQLLPGVIAITNGYAGGTTANPTYEEVCSGKTGHAEVIQVEFDPTRVSYEKILETFWEAHDPTTLNRQGNDVGTQYRSIILYHDARQKAVAEQSKTAAQRLFVQPILTEIVPFTTFYPGEDYHQNYYRSNPNQPYCRAVIRPKVEKFRAQFRPPPQ